MKIAKCGELYAMWEYRSKQKKKVALFESLVAAAKDGPTAQVIPDAHHNHRTVRPESVEMSGRRGPNWSDMLQLTAAGRDN